MDGNLKNRNNRRIELTFKILDAMEDMRDVWRAAAPELELDEQGRDEALKLIQSARKSLDGLEKTL